MERVVTGLILSLSVFVSTCDTTFDPFERSPLEYSIMGYLDASADTQYVRIERIRDSLLIGSGPVDVSVTLEALESGEKYLWRDSLFRFSSNVMAHNYWTDASLDAGKTYRLEVDPLNGNPVVTSVITLPDSFPAPTARELECMNLSFDCGEYRILQVDIPGINKLAAFSAVYHIPDYARPRGCKAIRIPYWRDVASTSEGFRGSIQWKRDLELLASRFTGTAANPHFAMFEVFVASGGPEWPDFSGIDQETLFLPDAFTNVEHGIGFVGGVVSRTHRFFDDPAACDARP